MTNRAKKLAIVDLFNVPIADIAMYVHKGVPIYKIYDLLISNLTFGYKRRLLYELCNERTADIFLERFLGDYMEDYKPSSITMIAFKKIRTDYQHITKGWRDFS